MEKLVGSKKRKSYIAASLGDIATFIGSLAENERKLSANTQRDKARNLARADAYADVADMLQSMRFSNGALARMVKEVLDGEERKELLDALSNLLSMDDIDGLKERLP